MSKIPTSIKLYQAFSQVKKQLLFSVFGYVSHCKHTPSCGQYGVLAIKKHGTIWGTILTIKRVATCW